MPVVCPGGGGMLKFRFDGRITHANNDICSIEASLNQDLSNINRWLIAKKLTLNIKTKIEQAIRSPCLGN